MDLLDPRFKAERLKTVPLRVAIIGAGIFSQSAYVPLVQIDTVAKHGERGFEEILSDQDVDACLVILPTASALHYVLKALAAGKAVLSEKPISACFADAKNAIEASRKICRPVAPKPLWFVAENFRFESVFEEAARLVPLCGGVGRVDLVAEAPLNYWYFGSKWRNKQSAHAFMIHSSVHHMAALRLLAGATHATRATSVHAQTFYDHQPLQRSHRDARHMHEGRASAGSHALDVECEDDMHVDYPGADAVPLGTATGVSAKLTWDSGLVSNVWLCMIASSVCCCCCCCCPAQQPTASAS